MILYHKCSYMVGKFNFKTKNTLAIMNSHAIPSLYREAIALAFPYYLSEVIRDN